MFFFLILFRWNRPLKTVYGFVGCNFVLPSFFYILLLLLSLLEADESRAAVFVFFFYFALLFAVVGLGTVFHYRVLPSFSLSFIVVDLCVINLSRYYC